MAHLLITTAMPNLSS